MGPQRLHPRLRRAAAPRRPPRRRLRATPRLRGRPGDLHGRLRLGGFAQTPGQLVATRALQGVGAALAAPSVLALLTTSAPDEAARNRAFALFGAVSSGGASIGLILGGLLTDVGSWRWTLFINVPARPRRAAPGRTLRRRDAPPPRSLRPGRRRQRDHRRRLPGVGPHRGAGARLGLAPAPSAASSSAPRCSCCSPAPRPGTRTRWCSRTWSATAAASARSPPWHWSSARTCRCSSSSSSTSSSCSATARSPSGFAFLPFSLGIFGMSRITPWLIATGRAPRHADDRHRRPHRGVRLAQRRGHDRHLPRRDLRPDADRRPGDRTGVHADHGHRALAASSPSTPDRRPACCRPPSSSAAPWASR